MKPSTAIFLSMISGAMLVMAWPISEFTILIFAGFVPLFFIAEYTQKATQFWLYCFFSLFIWNVGTTWWIWNSTDVGSIAAMMANALLMCLPWWGYFTVSKKIGTKWGGIAFICFWLLFEYIHLNWELSWPWLTLGNVFANQTQWIQWYEYTGVAGGTCWVLAINILIFNYIKHKQIKNAIAPTILISLPIIVSFFVGLQYNNSINPDKNIATVIVQPNIDPYSKFNQQTIGNQIQKLVSLTKQSIDSNTQLIIWPETAMNANDEQFKTPSCIEYQPIYQLLKQFPKATLISGIEMYRDYGAVKATETARLRGINMYYDNINGAVAINNQHQEQYYYKMKLVPGVERLPGFLNFMAPIFEQFGGSTGGYARDTAVKIFDIFNQVYCAPIICYESIYGKHVANYVKKGANLLTIVTNDGWWGNTPGHKQHLAYAQLRAIETRKWVARSANTGISAVIDAKGTIITTQPWDTPATIKAIISTNNYTSFYVNNGDYIYQFGALMGIIIIIWQIGTYIQKRLIHAKK